MTDAVYDKLEKNALSTLRTEMAGMKQELGKLIGEVGGKVDQLDAEFKIMNENVGAIRGRELLGDRWVPPRRCGPDHPT